MGFIGDLSGNYSTFSIPGTYRIDIEGLNDAGQITGLAYFNPSNPTVEGFVRDSDGTLTLFNLPGATGGTYPYAINDLGEIVGSYSILGVYGTGMTFLREPDGSFTTIALPTCPG